MVTARPLVLVLEADQEVKASLDNALSQDYDLQFCDSSPALMGVLAERIHEVRIIFLSSLPLGQSPELLISAIKSQDCVSEVIFASEPIDVETAVRCMKAGAYDYVEKPMDVNLLEVIFKNALRQFNALKKLDELAKRAFQNQIDVDRWSRFLKEMVKSQREVGRIVTLEEILKNFPVFVQYNPDALAEMEKRSAEFEFAKRFLDRGKMRILVVEDEAEFRELLAVFLRDHYEVVLVGSGDEARAVLEKTPDIELMLLDIHLPDGKGSDRVAEFKALAPEMEVIMITAYQEIKLAVASMRDGAADYLSKPFLKDELLLVLSQVSQRYYVETMLPRLGRHILGINRRTKIRLLNDLCLQRYESSQAVYMRDIYLFFPELKVSNIPDDRLLQESRYMSGVDQFLEHLFTITGFYEEDTPRVSRSS